MVFTKSINAESLLEHSMVVVPDAVSDAFLADLDHPPLSSGRSDDLVAGSLALSEDATALAFALREPLAPDTPHTLAISAALRAQDGDAMSAHFVYEFTTGGIAAGAPQMALRFPVDEALDLPTNLAAAIVAFSETVTGVDDSSLGIEGVVTRVRAAPEWCANCYAIEPQEALQAARTYEVVARAAIVDAKGCALFAGSRLAFTSGTEPDLLAPLLGATSLAQADGCVVARWITDELASSEMNDVMSPEFVQIHELGFPVRRGTLRAVAIASRDWAGNRATLELEVPEVGATPRVRITEVLANPSGPEPAQEWIEVVNVDRIAIDLAGWRIADSAGEDELPATILGPGEAALIVGATYDPLEGSDPPPHPLAQILRLASPIGAGGLRNGGEVVRLLDSAGQSVSSFRGLDTGQGQSAIRIGMCDVTSSWIASPPDASTPGVF